MYGFRFYCVPWEAQWRYKIGFKVVNKYRRIWCLPHFQAIVTTTFWDVKKRDAVKCQYVSSSTLLWSSCMRLANPRMSDTGICLNPTPFWLKIFKYTNSFTSFGRDVCCYVTFPSSFFSQLLVFCFSSPQSGEFLLPAVAGEESSQEMVALPHQLYTLMSSLTQQ